MRFNGIRRQCVPSICYFYRNSKWSVGKNIKDANWTMSLETAKLDDVISSSLQTDTMLIIIKSNMADTSTLIKSDVSILFVFHPPHCEFSIVETFPLKNEKWWKLFLMWAGLCVREREWVKNVIFSLKSQHFYTFSHIVKFPWQTLDN